MDDRYHICLFSSQPPDYPIRCGEVSPDGLATIVNELIPDSADLDTYEEWRADDPTDTYLVQQWTWPTGRVLFSRA